MDPVFSTILRFGLAVIFLLAAVHKFRDLAAFRTVLAGYDVLPIWACRPVSLLVPVLEAVIVVGLALGVAEAPLMASAVLGIYALLIAFNIARGRRDMDCGCHWGNTAGRSRLHWGLVVRNIILIGIALSTVIFTSDRYLVFVDYLNIAAGTLFVLVSGMALIAFLQNHQRMKDAGHV